MASDGSTPVEHALHPVSILAVALLLLNDWWLKPSGYTPWLAGKLSDVCGLIASPLVLSAAIDVGLGFVRRVGSRREPAASRFCLLACIAATGATFVAVKLSPAIAGLVAVLPGARIVSDPTDLIALPGLAIAGWIGADQFRRHRGG